MFQLHQQMNWQSWKFFLNSCHSAFVLVGCIGTCLFARDMPMGSCHRLCRRLACAEEQREKERNGSILKKKERERERKKEMFAYARTSSQYTSWLTLAGVCTSRGTIAFSGRSASAAHPPFDTVCPHHSRTELHVLNRRCECTPHSTSPLHGFCES